MAEHEHGKTPCDHSTGNNEQTQRQNVKANSYTQGSKLFFNFIFTFQFNLWLKIFQFNMCLYLCPLQMRILLQLTYANIQVEKGKDFSVLLQELRLQTVTTPLIKDRDLHKVWLQNTHVKNIDLNFLA